MRHWLALGAAALALAGSPAKAATYNLDFTGSTFDVIATIVTGASAPGGGYDITSISGYDTSKYGTYNITGLIKAPGTPPNQGVYYASNGLGWTYNDVFYPSGNPYVANSGPLFADASGNIMNLYSTGPNTYYLSVDNPGGSLWNPGDRGTLTAGPGGVSQTPLPSTWMMLIAGIVGLGFLAYRGTKGNSAAPAIA